MAGVTQILDHVDTGGLLPALAAGSTAATINGTAFNNIQARGILVTVDVTVATSMTLTVNIQFLDGASGKWVTLLASAALAAVATTTLTVYPGAVNSANVSASGALPRTWRVQAVVTGTLATATVGAQLLQ